MWSVAIIYGGIGLEKGGKMTKSLPQYEWKHLNLEELREQVKVRKDLINLMVGTFWPRVVYNEINMLKAIIKEKEDKNG